MQIHVERVIGVVRQKFTILKSTLPINMIMSEDSEIVTVACVLRNHRVSVVPFD